MLIAIFAIFILYLVVSYTAHVRTIMVSFIISPNSFQASFLQSIHARPRHQIIEQNKNLFEVKHFYIRLARTTLSLIVTRTIPPPRTQTNPHLRSTPTPYFVQCHTMPVPTGLIVTSDVLHQGITTLCT